MGEQAVHTLRPDRHFDTIASRGGIVASQRELAEVVAALCGGTACALVSRKAGEGLMGMLRSLPAEAGGLATGDGVAFVPSLSVGDGLCVHACDLRTLAKGRGDGDASGLWVADNTLAGPWLCRPLQMGFDVVVEDLRDWLGVDAYALAARSDRQLHLAAGLCGADLDATGLARASERLATTSLLAQRRCDAALTLAHFLDVHPLVEWVSYPGLPQDQANDAARRCLEHGFGALVIFRLAGGCGAEGANRAFAAAAQRGWLAQPSEPCGTRSVIGRACSLSGAPALEDEGEPVLYVRCGTETPLDIVEAVESALATLVPSVPRCSGYQTHPDLESNRTLE